MAHAEEFSEDVLEMLASGMRVYLAGLSSSLREDATLEIREIFKVFELSLEAIRDSTDKTLEDRAVWRHQWHIQLFQEWPDVGFVPVGFALAIGGAMPESVQGVFISDLAAAVDEAVKQIDAEVESSNPEVNLLVAPSHQLHMLRIKRADKQIIPLERKIEAREAPPYNDNDILDWLRGKPPIVGLGGGT